jgi:hypothetical protein
MRNSVVLLLLCVVSVVAAACKRDEPAAPPVARATLTLNKDKAAIGSPLAMTYKFEVAQNVDFDDNYAVFVHVTGPDGDTLWQDDHQPPTPTTRWKAGETVEYTRMVFVPNYPYIGDASIRIGLYSPTTSRRLTLAGEDAGKQEYVVGRLNLLPQADNIYLIYKDGWHNAEVDPANPLIEWQWTKKTALLAFKNPKRDATFYLKYDARADLNTPPQQVKLTINGQPFGTFAAVAKDPELKTFPITATQFGEQEMVELAIDVDRTFNVAGDARDLGIRIYHAFVEPK